jgi:hypothetical protein
MLVRWVCLQYAEFDDVSEPRLTAQGKSRFVAIGPRRTRSAECCDLDAFLPIHTFRYRLQDEAAEGVISYDIEIIEST